MSTAILISGQLRTFAQCYPTQRWMIFRYYGPDIHFFVSCVDDEQAASAELLYEHYPRENVHIEKYTDPTDLPVIPMEAGAHAPYANAVSQDGTVRYDKLLLQHWGNKKVWDFFFQTPKPPINTVIRIRPDQFIHRFTPPKQPYLNQCYCPYWGKFGGVNDRVAVMGTAAAASYFGTYDVIEELLKAGCPFHPESLVAASLSLRNPPSEIQNTLLVSCSTQRVPGDPRGERRWPEITAEDVAELIATK